MQSEIVQQNTTLASLPGKGERKILTQCLLNHHDRSFFAFSRISFFLGGTTILLSIFCWFLLGTPREVAWVSSEERRIAQARIVANRTGTDHHKRRQWKKDQVIEAFIDPSTWFLFCSVVLAGLPNGGISSVSKKKLVKTHYAKVLGSSVWESGLYEFWVHCSSNDFIRYSPPSCFHHLVPPSRIPLPLPSIAFLAHGQESFPLMTTNNLLTIKQLFSIVPGFIGLVALSLLPDSTSYRWIKFGMYFMVRSKSYPPLYVFKCTHFEPVFL